MAEKTSIWTPDGLVSLGGKKADRIELPAGLIEWFRQAADFFGSQKIGMHCAICQADIIGKNADSDRVFSATCGCREWVGANREYRGPDFGTVSH